eukprot:361574-Chlamydomonas_euryale.AAC.1
MGGWMNKVRLAGGGNVCTCCRRTCNVRRTASAWTYGRAGSVRSARRDRDTCAGRHAAFGLPAPHAPTACTCVCDSQLTHARAPHSLHVCMRPTACTCRVPLGLAHVTISGAHVTISGAHGSHTSPSVERSGGLRWWTAAPRLLPPQPPPLRSTCAAGRFQD